MVCLPILVIRGLDSRAYKRAQPSAGHSDLRLVLPGGRDAAFYREVARICQRVHQSGGTNEDAFTEAMARHAEFPIPHDKAEHWVRGKTDYWWPKTIAGENRFGLGHCPHVIGWEERLAGNDPFLHSLLTCLREWNGAEAKFWIANGLVGTRLTGRWSEDRLRQTRLRALNEKWIEKLVDAAQGRNAVYRWGPTALATIFAYDPQGGKNDNLS
jgi:hypothetical protein